MLHLDGFISKHITKRISSLFLEDIKNHSNKLRIELENKSVLVIGGAGTIGSNFIKSILEFNPRSLVVVDINENGLTELTRDLRCSNLVVPSDYVTYPLSYSDLLFEKMFRNRGGFDIVANFSAHKHVRSEKDLFSVQAMLENNVLNAKKLMDILVEFPPKHFFCVSTDKAANPVNVMGASKKIMEELIISYAPKYKVTTARFANVAFSNGSLPAGFLERISKQQPITAPSDVTRFFVSPQESGHICMLACILGNSGEIFFPKLNVNEVMTFSDIAEKLLSELGFDVQYCFSEDEAKKQALNLKNGSAQYPVYFSKSDTTGEKEYEEFYTEFEEVNLERFSSLGVVVNIKPKSIVEIDSLFFDLREEFGKRGTSKTNIINILKQFLPNFEHKDTGKILDNKM